MALVATATKLLRYLPRVEKDEKKNIEIILRNGLSLSMMLESELLSIGLIIIFLDN